MFPTSSARPRRLFVHLALLASLLAHGNALSVDDSFLLPFSYEGCYRDSPDRMLPYQLTPTGSERFTNQPQLCAILAAKAGFTYFAVQNGNLCFGGSDLPRAKSLGPSSACGNGCLTATPDRVQCTGGSSANSLYALGTLERNLVTNFQCFMNANATGLRLGSPFPADSLAACAKNCLTSYNTSTTFVTYSPMLSASCTCWSGSPSEMHPPSAFITLPNFGPTPVFTHTCIRRSSLVSSQFNCQPNTVEVELQNLPGRPIYKLTKEDCALACRSTPFCTHFSYNSDDISIERGQCTLKKAVAAINTTATHGMELCTRRDLQASAFDSYTCFPGQTSSTRKLLGSLPAPTVEACAAQCTAPAQGVYAPEPCTHITYDWTRRMCDLWGGLRGDFQPSNVASVTTCIPQKFTALIHYSCDYGMEAQGADMSGMPLTLHSIEDCGKACRGRPGCTHFVQYEGGRCLLKSSTNAPGIMPVRPGANTCTTRDASPTLDTNWCYIGYTVASPSTPLPANRNITSQEQCAQACAATPSCSHFTYNTASATCTLRTGSRTNLVPTSSIETRTCMPGNATASARYACTYERASTALNLPGMPLKFPTQEDCARACQQNANCSHFTFYYYDTDTRCFLKTGALPAGDGSAQPGAALCTPTALDQFTCTMHRDAAGQDLPGMPLMATKYEECARACQNSTACTHFSYYSYSRMCSLKKTAATPPGAPLFGSRLCTSTALEPFLCMGNMETSAPGATTTIRVPTSKACAEACQPGSCSLFSFTPATRTCVLRPDGLDFERVGPTNGTTLCSRRWRPAAAQQLF